MANQILVKSPLTTNGNNPVIGKDGKMIYTESVLMASARATLEKQNTFLPEHLRKIIEDYTPPAETVSKPTTKPVANATA